jgi:hypothetical protein
VFGLPRAAFVPPFWYFVSTCDISGAQEWGIGGSLVAVNAAFEAKYRPAGFSTVGIDDPSNA